MPPPAPPVVVAPKVVDKPLVVAPLPATPQRLPHTFEPTSYAVRLHVDPAQPSFSGTIEITGELTESSALIWLNAEDLVINDVAASQSSMRVRLRATTPADGWLALQSEQPLAAGTWTLSIEYTGEWNNQRAVGGFRETPQGLRAPRGRVEKQDAYVFTQFEPDYARRVFPCFDEPDRKVPWQLTLDVPDELVAASNTAIESEIRSGGPYSTKTVRFARTSPLPSYLIAFAVGPFDIVDAGASQNGTPVRILALRGHGNDAAAAAQRTAALLDKIEAWIGVPFAYPKVDLVSVPSTEDWWLAMENAGLITFRTEALGQRWDEVVLHELAHHWFGDLVTLAWWDDIWLNESFAYWLGNMLSDAHYPTGTGGELPIVQPVTEPRPHHGGPYAGTYKGQLFLALLDSAVGTEPLKRALKTYLTSHAHGTVHTDDLRTAIKLELGDDIAGIFDRYVHARTTDLDIDLHCDSTSKRIEVKGFDTVGLFCVAYDRDGQRADRCAKLAWGSASLELGTKRCPRWILPKALHGLTWTQAELEALRDYAWPVLTKDERLTLVMAALSLNPMHGTVRLSYIEKAVALDDPTVTTAIASYLDGLEPQIPPALRPDYDAWVIKTFGPRARAFGIASDLPVEKRYDVYWLLSIVLKAGDATLRAQALKLMPKLDSLEMTTRILVLRAAIVDRPAFADELASQLPKATPDRRQDIAYALDAAPDLLGLMQRHVAEIKLLNDIEKSRLLGAVCDETKRADVEKVGRELDPKWDQFSIRNFEWCVAERKALEPVLRAFLTSAPAAAKASQERH